MKPIADLLRKILIRIEGPPPPVGQTDCESRPEYIDSAPSDQNAIDLFPGQWSSAMPSNRPDLKAGPVNLFEDERIYWTEKEIGGFQDKRVLELGPLEAGHSCMMEQMGAQSVLAIESNTQAFLRCLVTKEIFGLTRTRFKLGNFVEFLKTNEDRYDLCLASGVLYHMKNPAELIDLISQAADTVALWTHYYDETVIKNTPKVAKHFIESTLSSYKGFDYTLYRQEYQISLKMKSFCGGIATYSHWIRQEDILNCFRHFGFSRFEINFDHKDHVNGPAFMVIANR